MNLTPSHFAAWVIEQPTLVHVLMTLQYIVMVAIGYWRVFTQQHEERTRKFEESIINELY